MGRFYAAVDIGATNVRVALGDKEGLAEKRSERTDRENGAAGVSWQIVRMIGGLSAAPASIGVGSIGPIDLSTGSIEDTPNLPFKVIPIAEPLREAFGVPVAMLNDCSAAVLGESEYGAGKGLDNLVYVTLSTGLGGGAIVDGHLLVGKDGNAVEVGHLTIDPDSPLVCGCGCRGHWEAYCSGANIPDYARLLLQGERLQGILGETTGWEPMNITSENLFDAARKGNSQALHVVRKIGEVNAVGFADIVNVFDPQLITVGGSIALHNPGLVLEPIKSNIRRHLINREPEIVITPLGDDAVLMGALALARGSTR
ncbi:MAG: ROK family protein [Candidatus Bathyarchaeota archaeon]|nr:MAG: ROK family protein [Candidatus Bathyarchaeota archaeon]